ncbi:hypothetical protein F5Y16DRAFT_406606 [Xylariaceae sp. FL0255]|nr:hypothetical protein F5Y16DRAFT_406606 [Xylariaceae sp. FL0255]
MAPPNSHHPETKRRTEASTLFGHSAKDLVSRNRFSWNDQHVIVFKAWIREKGANATSGDLTALLSKLDLDGYENIFNFRGENIHNIVLKKIKDKITRTKFDMVNQPKGKVNPTKEVRFDLGESDASNKSSRVKHVQSTTPKTANPTIRRSIVRKPTAVKLEGRDHYRENPLSMVTHPRLRMPRSPRGGTTYIYPQLTEEEWEDTGKKIARMSGLSEHLESVIHEYKRINESLPEPVRSSELDTAIHDTKSEIRHLNDVLRSL